MNLKEWTSCGGCAAKWPGDQLSELLRSLVTHRDPSLVLGLDPFDDAAVYLITPELALVSTTDFFPPLVEDPDDFGAIAAANACSDVFAMGGRVILALNISAFPETFPQEAIGSILSSAAAVVEQAGGSVAGGHTIRCSEPVFGLAVQGLVHPDRIWTKHGALPGDVLLLSKPIGTGIVLAGGDSCAQLEAIETMRLLNDGAAMQLRALEDLSGQKPVHAVTDVTGFGLAGHSWEIAKQSDVTIRITVDSLPLLNGALAQARAGVKPAADQRNRAYLRRVMGSVPSELEALVFDPQTSGGLLAAVESDYALSLISQGWWRVGEIVQGAAAVQLLAG